jgi:DNA-binding HxlR family transcriptional regulator
MAEKKSVSPFTGDGPLCSMERSLHVLGERWTLLVLREIFAGEHRFSDIRASLGIAPNLLSGRLAMLVEMGILRTLAYQEPGQRHRQSYHLTQAGRDLHVVLAGLQPWGDQHLPSPSGAYFTSRSRTAGEDVHVAFVDAAGHEVPAHDVLFLKTAAEEMSAIPREDEANVEPVR